MMFLGRATRKKGNTIGAAVQYLQAIAHTSQTVLLSTVNIQLELHKLAFVLQRSQASGDDDSTFEPSDDEEAATLRQAPFPISQFLMLYSGNKCWERYFCLLILILSQTSHHRHLKAHLLDSQHRFTD